MTATLLGYARVSTVDQNPELQQDALTAAGCYRVFTDKASGSLTERPQLTAVLDQLRPGDTLVVWKLDRLGRSLPHLIEVVTGLEQRGVHFRSLQDGIDTSTAAGRFFFHVIGAVAQFERDMIRERTQAGLAAARARGRTGGRPTTMTPDKVAVARQMYESRQHTVAAIAAVLGVSRASIYRHVPNATRAGPMSGCSCATGSGTRRAWSASAPATSARSACSTRRRRTTWPG